MTVGAPAFRRRPSTFGGASELLSVPLLVPMGTGVALEDLFSCGDCDGSATFGVADGFGVTFDGKVDSRVGDRRSVIILLFLAAVFGVDLVVVVADMVAAWLVDRLWESVMCWSRA